MDNQQAWRENAEKLKELRKGWLFQFQRTIKDLIWRGFEVKEISPFQYRINGVLDIYPSKKNYHDLVKNKRGRIRGKSFGDFIRNYFGIKVI